MSKENITLVQEYVKDITIVSQQSNQLINANEYQNALTISTNLKVNIEQYIKNISPKPIPSEVGKIYKSTLFNLAFCSFKLGNYTESIVYDKFLLKIDENNDGCYARLFSSYLAMNKREDAVLYGSLLKYRFNKQTLEKYKDILPLIESETNSYKEESSSWNLIPRDRNKPVLYVKLIIIFIAICYIIWCLFNRDKLNRFTRKHYTKH